MHQEQLLQDIKSILSYHHELGVDGYPLAAGGAEFCQKAQLVNVLPDLGREEKTPISEPEQDQVTAGSIQDIEDEVVRCTSCNLREKRIVPVQGSGGDNIKICFVGGWLASSGGYQVLKGTVFGFEEDQMIARMLKAIGLSEKDAFVTNVIKCGIPDSIQPGAKNIQACSSYLHRQIALLSPDIICTMGIIATRVFLDISRPLSQLRGRFHTHTTATKKTIRVLPTYHPTFLLQNPEMKKATWVDLQLMDKELKKIARSR